MNDAPTQPRDRSRWAGPLGLLTAGVITGGLLAGTVGASAASNSGTGAQTSTATSAATGTTTGTSTGESGSGTSARPPRGGAQPVRSDETSVSSVTAAKLRAAALKAVPGGTVYRVETDAGDGAYEAHMQKADGTLVTVTFDANLAVTKVESGMGTGDPAGGRPSAG